MCPEHRTIIEKPRSASTIYDKRTQLRRDWRCGRIFWDGQRVTVRNVPVEVLIMINAGGVFAFDVDTYMRRPRIRSEMIAVLRDVVTTLLEESPEGEVDR